MSALGIIIWKTRAI